jgi:hypothetical protein
MTRECVAAASHLCEGTMRRSRWWRAAVLVATAVACDAHRDAAIHDSGASTPMRVGDHQSPQSSATAPLIEHAGSALAPPQDQLGATIRDSAGVRLVLYDHMPSLPVAFHLSATPLFTVGERTSDPRYEFPSGVLATRLSGGQLIVSVFAASDLRVYDRAGHFVRTIGREGQGPGEFEGIGLMCRVRGDSLLVVDRNDRRLSVLDSAGNVAYQHAVVRPLPRCPVNGALFMTYTLPASEQPDSSARDPRRRVRLVQMERGPNAKSEVDLGMFPSGDGNLLIAMRNAQGQSGGRLRTQRPFGRVTTFAPDGDEIYIGEGTTYEIRTLAADGRLLRILRIDAAPEPVTPELRDAFRAEQIAPLTGQSRQDRDGVLRQRSLYPSRVPAYGDVRVDGARRLWVQKYPLPAQKTQEWTVFNRDGEMLGLAAMPADLRVLEIDSDYVLGEVMLIDRDGPYAQLRLFALSPGP